MDTSPAPRKPPGKVMNAINKFMHYPVAGQLIEGVQWAFLAALAGLLAPLIFLYKVVRALKAATRGAEVVPASKRASLGVFISGCDTGFGKNAAVTLHALGYTVFAGCFTSAGEASLQELAKGDPLMVAVSLDVTSDESVEKAAARVDRWLSGATGTAPRALLAAVCNAGVATGGCIDWLKVDDFERDFSVNFYGVIRVVKAMLPMLKRTAALRREAVRSSGETDWPPQPRFVVNSSIAGKVPVAYLSPYSTSKHASDTFAACARMELAQWGIGVTTVLASFHTTPMVANGITFLDSVWKRTPPQTRAEYGDKYFAVMRKSTISLLIDFAWDPLRVNEALVRAATNTGALDAEVYCGLDSRYVMQVVCRLPSFACETTVENWMAWYAKKEGVYPAAIMREGK